MPEACLRHDVGEGREGVLQKVCRRGSPHPEPPHKGEWKLIGDCVVLFKFKVVVKDDERAFLTRDGRFERLLGPGRFVAFDYGRRLAAEMVKVVRAEVPADKALLIARTRPAVATEHFEIVQAGPTEVAIVSFDR
jgi:hypothetical protein